MKTTMFSLPFLGALAMLGIGFSSSAEEPLAYTPQDVEMKIEQVGPSPLPYQAVRLRLTIRNTSKKRVGPLFALESSGLQGIKGPGDNKFEQQEQAFTRFRLNTGRTISAANQSPLEWTNRTVYLYLDPGEQTSVSIAFAHKHNPGPDGSEDKRYGPMFSKSGEYSAKWLYKGLWTLRQWDIERVVKIQVQEPKGDDKTICTLLEKDSKLAFVMMSPVHIPDWEIPRAGEELIPRLKAIYEKYPNSSYADYARFAVARLYIERYGFESDGWKTGQAMLAKLAPKRFAYQGQVLGRMWRFDSKSSAELYRLFPDDLDFLETFAGSLGGIHPGDPKLTADLLGPNVKVPEDRDERGKLRLQEWWKFRKRVPAKE